ncbi:MAG: autotransporter-associated beta strand repeat-containing protein [Pirellulales bacterium]
MGKRRVRRHDGRAKPRAQLKHGALWVDFRNAINLGAAVRVINVLDNGNTGADYAVMSGNLSGVGGGLQKIGAGVLTLTGANTYTGTTDVNTGTLRVTSLGNHSDALNTATSVGLSGVTMDNSNAILIGNGGTGGGILQYVGAGEVSDRKIRLNSTTGGAQIHADGTGALILTNVANDSTLTGAKTLSLRGSSTVGNMITSQLSNDGGGGVLSVTIDGNATWILSNDANNYTGNTTVSAGALGIGSDTAIGATLVISNGNVFAYGGDRTITNTLTLNNNASHGFLGDYSLTFTGTVNLATSANTVNTYNNIVAGKALTFNGLLANSLTANRTWNVDGSGETIINGDFTTTTAFGVLISKTGDGTLTLGGTGVSNFNQAGATIDIDRGTLKFVGSNAISSAAGAGGLTLSPEIATGDVSILDLHGTSQTVNAFTSTTDGTVIVDNTAATDAVFRFGANNSAVNFGSNAGVASAGSYTITDSGAGRLSIVKLGTSDVTLTNNVVLTYQGTTSSEGGVLRINADLAGSTGLSASGSSTLLMNGLLATTAGNVSLSATGASTLSLSGGIANPGLITSVAVGGGSILSLLDGAGSQIVNLTALNLGGGGTGSATLNLNIGDSATDTFRLLTGGVLTLGNSILFNLTDAGLSANTTYTLLNVIDGGLAAFGTSNFVLGTTPGGFDGFTWNVTDNLVQITTGNLVVGDLYWRGLTSTAWNIANNWSTDKAGTTPATSSPGQGNRVVFAFDGVGTGPLTTTLEQNFRINSLVFESGATVPSSVTIAPGASAGNRLEIAPTSAAAGISISSGGPAAVTISAPLRIGANQTWNVADAAGVLTISGGLQGEADVTKAGAGKVVISAAADPTFNAGQSADFIVNGGSLEVTNLSALGLAAQNNLANVVVNGGGAFYYNGAAGTLLNPISLAGGSLSAGGGNQTYGGNINVTADSFILMRDSNAAATNATVRNITLSGILSGSGTLTVDSNDTLTGGNAEGGTLTISNNANTWNGRLIMNRGTVVTTATNGLGGGDIVFNQMGRIIMRAINGTTYNLGGTMTFSPNAIGEFSVDNTSGTLAADFVVNQNGAVLLGAGGVGATARFNLADVASSLNITGGIVLGGNSSLSVEGGDADSHVVISGVGISDGGNGYSLAINNEAGAWGVTSTRVTINVAGTYSGGTSLNEGILILGHKDALGTGAFTVTGTSTLQAGIDLSGANALPNAVVLSASLTVSGTNNLTFGNSVTQNGGNRTLTNSLTGGAVPCSRSSTSRKRCATAVRTLTIAGASTGNTTINALLNNAQNNILTNSLTAAPLTIGTIALSESAGTGRTLTLQGAGNTIVTGLVENIAGGGGTSGILTKSGTGTLTLSLANTYTGGTNLAGGRIILGTKDSLGTGTLTVTSGTLQVSSAMTGAGSVTNLVTLNGTLGMDGTFDLELSGAVNLTGSSTLNANGTGSTFTLTGPMTAAADVSLTLGGTGVGVITGGFTQPTGAASADLTVAAGDWTIRNGNFTIADDLLVNGGTLTLENMVFSLNDDIIVTGATTVLNLNTTGVWATNNPAGTTSGLYLRGGATVNINADDVNGIDNANGTDFILLCAILPRASPC